MTEDSDNAGSIGDGSVSGEGRRILVTGASGFIGKWLCKSLRELGYEVTGLSQHNGDISQKDYFEKCIDLEVDHVFHLAGRTFVPDSWEDPGAFYTTNVIGTLNTLEFCKKKNIPITFISAYIYGPQAIQPISESAEIRVSNPYAHSKYLAEQLCQFYAEIFSIRCTVVRPFNVYGYGQSERFLIPTIINQIVSSSEIKVRDLAPKRDYIYISDLVELLVRTIKQRERFAIYNAGSGYSLNVLDIIHIVEKLCCKSVKITEEGIARNGELSDTVAAIAKAKQEIGWVPKFTVESGIADILRQLGAEH